MKIASLMPTLQINNGNIHVATTHKCDSLHIFIIQVTVVQVAKVDQVKDMEKAAGDKVVALDTQEMPAIMMANT